MDPRGRTIPGLKGGMARGLKLSPVNIIDNFHRHLARARARTCTTARLLVCLRLHTRIRFIRIFVSPNFKRAIKAT